MEPGFPTESPPIAVHHQIVVASFLLILMAIGLFGNILVIISVVITKRLRTTTNILVVNLAFANLTNCLITPFQITALFSRTGHYPIHEAVCTIAAGVILVSICSGQVTLVAIAFVRWYVITKSIRGHRGIHTGKNIALLVVVIWIWSIAVMIVPPLLGIGTLGYSEFYRVCVLTDTNPLVVYYDILQGALLACALMITLLFYLLILRHVLQHNKQFRDKFGVDNDTCSHSSQASVSSACRAPMVKATTRREIDITKNLFAVVCVFMITYLPTSVNLFIPGSSPLTLYGMIFLMLNSVVNPIIYGLKHPNFQEAFKKILCCRRYTRGPVIV